MQLEDRGQAGSTSTDPVVSGPKPTTTAAEATSASAHLTATQSTISQFIPKQMTSAKQHSIDEGLANMIVTDFQPFSIMEDKGFKGFVKALNPTYTLPSRKTRSLTIIPKVYGTEHALWQDRVKKSSIGLPDNSLLDLLNHLLFRVCHLPLY